MERFANNIPFKKRKMQYNRSGVNAASSAAVNDDAVTSNKVCKELRRKMREELKIQLGLGMKKISAFGSSQDTSNNSNTDPNASNLPMFEDKVGVKAETDFEPVRPSSNFSSNDNSLGPEDSVNEPIHVHQHHHHYHRVIQYCCNEAPFCFTENVDDECNATNFNGNQQNNHYGSGKKAQKHKDSEYMQKCLETDPLNLNGLPITLFSTTQVPASAPIPFVTNMSFLPRGVLHATTPMETNSSSPTSFTIFTPTTTTSPIFSSPGGLESSAAVSTTSTTVSPLQFQHQTQQQVHRLQFHPSHFISMHCIYSV